MARLVVLQFENNVEADAFVVDRSRQLAVQHGQVVGVFAMPMKFCPNSGSGGCSTNKRIRAWSRGKKFGWWVCAICKLPSNYVPPDKRDRPELWRRVIGQGVNLLFPPEEQDPATVNDEGWGVVSRGG